MASAPATVLIEILNPFTEEVIERVPAAEPHDAADAAARARDALADWSALPPQRRVDCLNDVARCLRDRRAELEPLIVGETGLPLAQLRRGRFVRHAPASHVTSPGPSRCAEAAGVVAAITPGGMGPEQLLAHLRPALAAGCTVILKPSHRTPLCALALAETADLPTGVLQVVTGYGPVVGAALIADARIDQMLFAGSAAVAGDVARAAARSSTPVLFDVGAPATAVILDDADLVTALRATVERGLRHAGQSRLAPDRVLLPRARLRQAEEIAAELVAEQLVGDPLDPMTTVGPLLTSQRRDAALTAIRRALHAGARLIAGGVDAPAGCSRGYFVRPTVLSGGESAPLAPTLALIAHDGDDHALSLANARPTGYAVAWAGDEVRAQAFARRLRCARVDVNGAEPPTGWAPPLRPKENAPPLNRIRPPQPRSAP